MIDKIPMNPTISYKATFHPIGQGLFYSITISTNSNEFTMVYDCGSEHCAKHRNSVITNSNIPKVINILIISHFHWDHISGIPELMKGRKIIEVVLPFIDEKEREFLTLLIDHEYRSLGYEENNDSGLRNQLKELITDPVTFFSKNGFETTHVNFIDNTLNSPPLATDESQDGWSEDEPGQLIGSSPNVHKRNHTAIKTIMSLWKFKFYVKKTDQNKLDRLYKLLKHPLVSTTKIRDFDIPKYSGICNEIFSSKERNATSLVCCHGPTINLEKCSSTVKPDPTDIFAMLTNTDKSIQDNIHYHLLTGDAVLNNKQEFIDHYAEFLKSISIFQIPHHGSDDNWNVWFLEIFPSVCTLVCTFGEPNKHRHPSINKDTIKFVPVTDKCIPFNIYSTGLADQIINKREN